MLIRWIGAALLLILLTACGGGSSSQQQQQQQQQQQGGDNSTEVVVNPPHENPKPHPDPKPDDPAHGDGNPNNDPGDQCIVVGNGAYCDNDDDQDDNCVVFYPNKEIEQGVVAKGGQYEQGKPITVCHVQGGQHNGPPGVPPITIIVTNNNQDGGSTVDQETEVGVDVDQDTEVGQDTDVNTDSSQGAETDQSGGGQDTTVDQDSEVDQESDQSAEIDQEGTAGPQDDINQNAEIDQENEQNADVDQSVNVHSTPDATDANSDGVADAQLYPSNGPVSNGWTPENEALVAGSYAAAVGNNMDWYRVGDTVKPLHPDEPALHRPVWVVGYDYSPGFGASVGSVDGLSRLHISCGDGATPTSINLGGVNPVVPTAGVTPQLVVRVGNDTYFLPTVEGEATTVPSATVEQARHAIAQADPYGNLWVRYGEDWHEFSLVNAESALHQMEGSCQ